MNWVRRALTVTTILADVLPFENGVARTETPCHYLAKLGGVNMTLANVIEVAILVAVVVVAIRFFMRRD
jgi:hypothetical protein